MDDCDKISVKWDEGGDHELWANSRPQGNPMK